MRASSKWSLMVAAILALAVGVSSTAFAQASETKENTVKLGYLSCHVASGFGLIFGSSRELDCTYTPNTGAVEHYKGEINKFGADIGYLQSGVMLWTVLAPASMAAGREGGLAGHYAGATASATVGVGAGVYTLVGGMHDSFALQPIAIEGNNGLNVAAGVATMSLDWVAPKK